MKRFAFCLLLLLFATTLQPPSEANAFSCSAVCTSFYAAYSWDCTDTNCYAHNCGAPNGYDAGPGTCYCSYCP